MNPLQWKANDDCAVKEFILALSDEQSFQWGIFRECETEKDLVMEGGGDAGHQAPPHHLMDQVKFSSLNGFTDDKLL